MATYNGERVFRPRGQYQDHPSRNWGNYARRAVQGGGRIMQSDTGDYHVVSPSGAHWGTFKANQGAFSGGTLRQYEGDNNRDVTEDFLD